MVGVTVLFATEEASCIVKPTTRYYHCNGRIAVMMLLTAHSTSTHVKRQNWISAALNQDLRAHGKT